MKEAVLLKIVLQKPLQNFFDFTSFSSAKHYKNTGFKALVTNLKPFQDVIAILPSPLACVNKNRQTAYLNKYTNPVFWRCMWQALVVFY